MCILIPKYINMKFGGGVKVFTMNIRGAGHSVQGVSLNQAALCYTKRLIGLSMLQLVEGVQLGFSSVGLLSAWPLHRYLALSRNDIQYLVPATLSILSGSLRVQPQGCGRGVLGSLSPLLGETGRQQENWVFRADNG